MTDVKSQRRIAAKILKVGKNRVKIDPDSLQDLSLAITREDIRGHIDTGDIKKRKVKGVSRGRARANAAKKRKGQRKGPGSREGPKYSRLPRKTRWINHIRAQRKYLAKLRNEGYIEKSVYRKLYLQAKGGLFRSVRYLRTYIEEHGLAKKRLPDLK
ncbi:MAG: 50S ribosomal protein L19e [Candidatus Heimdallarchaeum endolithica]|uniref:Large ribosomal subunit protein eL19 n=1 Tax=Candidatus Heimdallarchaeum endolithica TaxID=2876572 RepID=A0A9Y1BQD7_9ARCH|nr:MAG: 50S ribosomal protein L19e [Candidatus Heimdallarchaeum endolithica]